MLSKNYNFKTTVLAIIFILFSLLYIPFNVFAQGQTNFDNSEEGAILDTILNENNSTESESTNSFSYLIYIWSFIGIVSIVIFIYGIISHKITLKSFGTQSKYGVKNKVGRAALKRDQRRKEDIKKIVNSLENFYKKNDRYPDAKTQELKTLVTSMHPTPRDPLESKQQEGGIQKYGYYYDNQNDPQYFKVWCILENPEDDEAQHYYNNTLHLYVKTASKEFPLKSIENKNINIVERNIPEKSNPELLRDVARKRDLKNIQDTLQGFFQQNNRYPNQEEFEKLITVNNAIIHDPRHNEETGFNNQRFGYYYDNLKLDETGKTINDYSIYRLWCLLENRDDPEVTHAYDNQFHWIYILTNPS